MFVPVTVIATWLSTHQSMEAKEMLLGGSSLTTFSYMPCTLTLPYQNAEPNFRCWWELGFSGVALRYGVPEARSPLFCGQG